MTPARKAAPGPPWQHWNTLQTFWASLYLIWALDLALLLTAILGAQVHRHAMNTIGKHTGPSIVHALHIKTELSDMDASVANELLGPPGKMQRDTESYEAARIGASKALIEAARNIPPDTKGKPEAGKDGPAETNPEQDAIEAIQVGMGIYEAKVQQARDLHDRAEPAFVNAYHDAAAVMDKKLLPQADKLDQLNHEELESTYNSVVNQSNGTSVLMLIVGTTFLIALVNIQRFLTNRTHRILNPLLLASTFVTLAFIFFTFQILASARHSLKVAKQDAFTSIHALLRASATAYSANADESRYLLDPASAKEHERQFNEKLFALAGVAGNITSPKVRASTSLLAEELRNITFDGEAEAIDATISALSRYVEVGDRIRRLQETGKHAEALELCIGANKGESNSAFDLFDAKLDETIKINQDAFDKAIKEGFGALDFFEYEATAIAGLIALLAFFGLLQRIKEYQ